MKWKRDSLTILIVAASVISVYAFYIFAWMPYMAKKEKAEDTKLREELARQSYVQVVNQSGHDVSITIFGHEEGDVVTSTYKIPKNQLLKLRQDINRSEMLAFPPCEMVDSVLFVYDDTLNYWQIPALDKASIADKHSFYERRYWKPTSIVVREEQHRPGYRPRMTRDGKEFVLTDKDYERATGVKRYKGQIFHEKND